jgi:hypothetical protein
MSDTKSPLDELRRLSDAAAALQSDLHGLAVRIRQANPSKEAVRVANKIEHASGAAANLRLHLEVTISHVECP